MKIDTQDKKRRLLTNVHGMRRHLYMTANTASEPLRIPCGSDREAQRFRFGLYASARVVKQNPDVDPGFLEAVENVIATCEGETVVLTRSELTKEGMAAAAALRALGLEPESGGVNTVAARVAAERSAALAVVVHSNPQSTTSEADWPPLSTSIPITEGFPGTAADDFPPINPYPRRNS